jgi:hypothetical protein
MRYLALLCCAGLLVGCGEQQQAASDEMEGEAAPMAEMTSLADFTGTWEMQALTESGDSVLVEYEMVATDDMDGWTITFPERETMPVRILAHEGDSIVTEVGPYESLFRPGVMVTTRSVGRLENGMMVGTFTATYETEDADSTMSGQSRGTKVQ